MGRTFRIINSLMIFSSIYQRFPTLRSNDKLKYFVHMLTFQNLYRKNQFEDFLNYTKTLTPDLQEYLENYNYNELVNNVRKIHFTLKI